jgi:O-antigen ligase
MGILVFALLMASLLWLAATNVPRFCAATLLLAGVPMSLTGAARFFSGPLDVDVQAIYMFIVAAGTALALILHMNDAQAEVRGRVMLVLLICYVTASLAWADSLVYGLRMLTKLSAPFLYLVLMALAVRQGLSERMITFSICGAGLISLTLAAINYASGGAIAPRLESPGFAGFAQLAAPFTSPADFSFTLSGALLVAYGAWSARRSAWMLAIVVAMLIGLVMALCRAAVVGALFGLLVFHLAGRRVRLYQSAFGIAVVLLAGVLFLNTQAFKSRMFFDPDHVAWSTLVTDRETFLANIDTSGRDELWQAALHDFSDNPAAFGGGIGTVDRWIRDRYIRGSELHSDVFRLYLDIGPVGLALYAAMMVSLFRRLAHAANRSSAPGAAVDVGRRVALAAIACYCSTLLTDNSLNYVTQFGLWVFGLAGAASAVGTRPVPAPVTVAPKHSDRRLFPNVVE